MRARALGLAAGLLLAACGGPHTGAPAPGTAVITGTTLDAATGQPLAGVEVTGPGGQRTTSDPAGRFVLRGIPEGQTGEVRARAPDGREAANPLRPLQNERLEVVPPPPEGRRLPANDPRGASDHGVVRKAQHPSPWVPTLPGR